MSNPIPSSVALDVIADGSPRIAAPVRNNFTDAQSALNALIAALSGGVAGQVLQSAGASAVQWANGNVVATKTTDQAVTTTAETDLLNGEFTLVANRLAASQRALLTLYGDAKFNAGASQASPRLKVKLGGVTILDTGALAAVIANSASRFSWEAQIAIAAKGATNAQWVTLAAQFGCLGGSAAAGAFTTGEGVVNATLGGAAGSFVLMRGGVAATVDTTASQALAVTVTTASGTSTDVTLKYAALEVI